MDQELFQNVKIFLEKEKGCSNVESEVPIKEKSSHQFKMRGTGTIPNPTDLGHIDIVGGRFYKDNSYTGIELHCIEYKSPNDDLIKGVGQILWYKFAISKVNTWVEQLFLYLMIHEEKSSEELKEFCKAFGIGLLQINMAKIITEIVTPENQHSFLGRQARDKTKLRCPQCIKFFAPEQLNCPDCGSPLEAEIPFLRHLFADKFGTSSRNQIYKGVPDRMPEEVEETPMLKKVFGNWSKVKESWRG